MKIKGAITIIILMTFQYNIAQDAKMATVIDSVKVNIITQENKRIEEKERLNKELKEQKKELRKQERIEEKTKDEKEILEKEKEKLKDDQNRVKKEQKEIDRKKERLNNARKLVEKRNDRHAEANKDLVKMNEKFERLKIKGKLSPVEVEQWNVKVSKQQLRIKEIEEDIFQLKEKLNKLE